MKQRYFAFFAALAMASLDPQRIDRVILLSTLTGEHGAAYIGA